MSPVKKSKKQKTSGMPPRSCVHCQILTWLRVPRHSNEDRAGRPCDSGSLLFSSGLSTHFGLSRFPLHSPRSPPSCDRHRLPRFWTENGLPRLDPSPQLVRPLAVLPLLRYQPRVPLGLVHQNVDARKAARRGWAGVQLH